VPASPTAGLAQASQRGLGRAPRLGMKDHHPLSVIVRQAQQFVR